MKHQRRVVIDMSEEQAREALMETADSLAIFHGYVNKERFADAVIERMRLWQSVVEARKGK